MKNLIKKIFFVFLLNSFLTFNAYCDLEELQEFAESLSEITQDFKQLSSPKLEDTKVIDASIQELNKAVEFVQQNLEKGNADLALKGAAFVNRTLNDITVDIPKNYKSNMENADMTKLGAEGLTEITSVTKALGEKKEKAKAELINNMVDINDTGFNAFEISKNINNLGIQTVQVDFEVKSREEMKNWTKEDWQEAWTGGIIADDGKQVITDKEISVQLASLNNQLGLVNEKNQLIKEKEDLRKKTQTQLNQLKDQLNDLEKQKGSVLSSIFGNKNNLDKQIKEKQKEIKEANTLISQFNKDITNIDAQLNNIQGQTASLNKINSDIQNLTNSGKTLAAKSNEIKSQLDKNNVRIGQLQSALQTRQKIARDAKTKYTSWEHNDFTYSGRKLFDSTLSNLAKEKNISVDLTNLTDQQRIDYYDKYKTTFDAVELWPQTSSKLYNIDSLKSDGTAAGWINRQKKVLSLEKEYLAQERGILKNKEELEAKIAEQDKVVNEFQVIQSQVQQNQSLTNVKKNELAALEVSINKISLDDPRKAQLEKLQADKITNINKIEGEVSSLNKELESNNNKLNTTLKSISSLESGVVNANTKLELLSEQLMSANAKKDLVSAKSRTDINKEMEAFETFGHVLRDTFDGAPSEVEIGYALVQPTVILSADPIAHTNFEYDKWGEIAGVSKEIIERGKAAASNKDFKTSLEVNTQIYQAISSKFDIDMMSKEEISKEIQEGYLEVDLVNLIRSNPTGINFDPNLAAIRWNKGAVTPKALESAVSAKYNEILQNSGYDDKLKEVEEISKEIKETREWIDQAQNTMTRENLWSNPEIKAEYSKKVTEWQKSQSKLFPLSMEVNRIQSTAQAQARDAVWTENNKVLVEQVKAVEDLNKMIVEKAAELPSYSQKSINRVQRVISELNPNSGRLVVDPSIENTAAKAKAAIWEEDGKMLDAYEIANDTLGKSFAYNTQEITGNLRTLSANYNPRTTNVEMAAKVQSTLNGTFDSKYIDGYMNAKYGRDQLEYEMDLSQLSAAERKEFEETLKDIFSEGDKKAVKRVENEIKSIENNIKSVETEKTNFSKDIENLNKEVAQIYKEEEKIQGQIASLQGDIVKTTETFKDKEAAITENINQISAIDFQLSQLQSEKSQLENKISTGNKELEAKLAEVAKAEADLKNVDKVVSGNTAEIDTKINEINKNAEALSQTTAALDKEIKALNEEVSALEKARPELEKQKAALNEKIEKLNNTKADLATAQAKNLGLDVNEKSVKSIPKMKNTSIVAVKGTGLVRLVDNSMIVNKAERFKDPVSKYAVNSNIFKVGAVKPSALLAQTSAGEVKVLKTYQYETAKANREKARESWNAQIAAGASKEVLAAEEAKWEAAKQVEIAAANSVREAGRTASSISNQSFASLDDLKETFAKEQAARAAQLETLISLRNTPGMNKWDVRSAESAIRTAKEEMKNARLAFESMKSKANYFSVLNLEAKKALQLQASIQQSVQSTTVTDARSSTIPGISESTRAEIQAQAEAEASAMTKDANLSGAYATAKAARLEARANWDSAMQSGNKAAQEAAEAAFMAAKGAEQAAGQAAARAAAEASQAAQAISTEVAQAAQQAASEAASEVKDVAVDAAREAQQAALDALWELERMPGSTGMHTLEVTAAIRQVQAEMNGNDFNYMGHSSYEAAMAAFAAAEAAGKTQMDLVNEVEGDHDPNRMGQCGERSC